MNIVMNALIRFSESNFAKGFDDMIDSIQIAGAEIVDNMPLIRHPVLHRAAGIVESYSSKRSDFWKFEDQLMGRPTNDTNS